MSRSANHSPGSDPLEAAAYAAIAEYDAYIAAHPRDELNADLRRARRLLCRQIRHRREVRRLTGA